jgi:hypothetical protein
MRRTPWGCGCAKALLERIPIKIGPDIEAAAAPRGRGQEFSSVRAPPFDPVLFVQLFSLHMKFEPADIALQPVLRRKLGEPFHLGRLN